jgi:plasmid maintenance system killer protein
MAAKPMRVVFINPGHADMNNPTGQFWPEASRFASAVAGNLNIKLEILHANRDHIRMRNMVREVLERDTKPHYLLLVNERFALSPLFEEIDKAEIPFFLAFNHYSKQLSRAQPQPRVQHRYWLGALVPDNVYAGYRLAQILIENSNRTPTHILAYSGDTVTSASLLRIRGLHRALSEYPDARLTRLVPGEWRYDIPEKRTGEFLKRYPDINRIWAANGAMGLGAIMSTEKSNAMSRVRIASINWDAEEITALEQRRLYASVGGHFMTAGWSLIMLYDYHHGRDFINDGGAYQQRKIFEALTRDTIKDYLPVVRTRDWASQSFKSLTKTHNPERTKYQFSLSTLLANQ